MRHQSPSAIAAASSAPAVVTATEGREAISEAIGKAGRGHGVNRTRLMLKMTEAVPIIIAL